MNKGPMIKLKGNHPIFKDIQSGKIKDLNSYTSDVTKLELPLTQDIVIGPFCSSYELNALEAAIALGHIDIVNTLLKVIDPGQNQSFSLTLAAGLGHLELVDTLLRDKRVDPTNTGFLGATNEALCWAIAAHDKHPDSYPIAIKLLSCPELNPSACWERALKVAQESKNDSITDLLKAFRNIESYIARGGNIECALSQEPDATVIALYIRLKREGRDPFEGLNSTHKSTLQYLTTHKGMPSPKMNIFGRPGHHVEHDYLDVPHAVTPLLTLSTIEQDVSELNLDDEAKIERKEHLRKIVKT